MDWKSIVGAVAPIAPKLGAVLGTSIGSLAGPIGAGIGGSIGGLAGNALAEIFGTEATPEAVGKAIAQDPDAATKIQQLEAERGQEILAQAQVKIEELKQDTERFRISEESGRASVSEVNQTMRAELTSTMNDKNRSFFYSGWRPMAGHLLNLLTTLIGIGIVYSMFKGVFTGNTEALALILNSLMSIAAFLAVLGSVVGVTAWGRSYEQGKAVQPSGPETTTVVTNQASKTPAVASIVRETIKALGGKKK